MSNDKFNGILVWYSLWINNHDNLYCMHSNLAIVVDDLLNDCGLIAPDINEHIQTVLLSHNTRSAGMCW